MKPGDFHKYAAGKIRRRLLDRVKDVLGPDAVRGGVLRATPDMPVERMQQLIDRAPGTIRATPSRFPGLEPVIQYPKGPLRETKPTPVDVTGQVWPYHPDYGKLSPEAIAKHDLLVQQQTEGTVRAAMQDELRSLAGPRGLRINLDEYSPDFNQNVLEYIRQKPRDFVRSEGAIGMKNIMEPGAFGSGWVEDQYRRGVSNWRGGLVPAPRRG